MKKLYIKRVCAVLGLILLVCCVERVAQYFVLPLSNLGVKAQRDRAALDGEITGLMLGASLASDGLVPELLDEALGGTSFNMGTNAQTMRMSYFALEDALNENPNLKHCLIEVSIRRMWRDIDDEDGLSKLAFLDYLRDGATRMRYFGETFELDDVPRMVSLTMRCQLKFAVDDPMQRLSPNYFRQYLRQGYAVADDAADVMGDRGNRSYTERVRQGGMGAEPQEPADARIVYTSVDGAENLEQLQRTVTLCRERGVQPVLITIPASDSWLMAYEDSYQDAHDYFAREAEAMGVPYFDFNFSKTVRSQLGDTDFLDETHMNKYGATVFSAHLADVLTGRAGADAFYRSFAETAEAIDGVVGLKATRSGRRVSVVSRQGAGVVPEYRFLIKGEAEPKESYRIIQDYSPDPACVLVDLKPGKYTLRAEARALGSDARFEAFSRLNVTVR